MSEFAEYVKAWARLVESGEAKPVEYLDMTTRTTQQNKALHLYLSQVADEMNAAGYDAKQVISLPIRLTPELVKDCIFKVIMRAMYPDKESSTELSTTEIQNVYETMNAATGEKFGVSLEWPSEESMSEAQR